MDVFPLLGIVFAIVGRLMVTVISLVKMATFARSRFLGEVIAVTGSVGKTSTKAMIALALESLESRIYQIYGNWNNRIGVALSERRDIGIGK